MSSVHFAGKTLLELVIEQFEDLLVRILLLAACISFVSMNSSYFIDLCIAVSGPTCVQYIGTTHTALLLPRSRRC